MLLTPTCHPVTGQVVSHEGREELGACCDNEMVPVIDDDTWAGLTLERSPVPPLGAFVSRAPVVTVASAEGLSDGLQLGWGRWADNASSGATRSAPMREAAPSVVTQLVVKYLIRNSDEVLDIRRRELADRVECTLELLTELLPNWSWPQFPTGGRSLWLRLPRGDADEFARVAHRHGVVIDAGPAFCVEGGYRDHIRIVFVQPRSTLTLGIERLARAWSEYTSLPHRARTRQQRMACTA
jgi:DNA-binding transcriptional MocR family regulator